MLKFLTVESSLTELLSGNVQAIFYVRNQDLLKIRRDPRFLTYYSINLQHVSAIVWNHGDPLFSDPAVRRALTFAINRRELHQVLNLPKMIPILDVMPTERQFRRGEFPDPLPYDPERARRLLDEAGWREIDGDGIRERKGKPYRFVALAPPGTETSAVYIQAQLRRVGIQMDVQTMDFLSVIERVKAGRFEAAMYVVNLKLTSPIGLLALFGQDSSIGYTHPKVIDLLNNALTTVDPDEIDRIHHELMPIFQADIPVTFLTPLVESMVVSRHVRGLSSPYHFDVVWYMENLWIEE